MIRMRFLGMKMNGYEGTIYPPPDEGSIEGGYQVNEDDSDVIISSSISAAFGFLALLITLEVNDFRHFLKQSLRGHADNDHADATNITNNDVTTVAPSTYANPQIQQISSELLLSGLRHIKLGFRDALRDWTVLYAFSYAVIGGITRGDMDPKALVVLNGCNLILSAFFLGVLTLKVPQWLGFYNKHPFQIIEDTSQYAAQLFNPDHKQLHINDGNDELTRSRLQLQQQSKLRYHVRVGIGWQFARFYFVLLPFMAGLRVWSYILSVVLGIVLGYSFIYGLYLARMRTSSSAPDSHSTEENELPKHHQSNRRVAVLSIFVLSIASSGMFCLGLLYISRVWGIHSPLKEEWMVILMLFCWVILCGSIHALEYIVQRRLELRWNENNIISEDELTPTNAGVPDQMEILEGNNSNTSKVEGKSNKEYYRHKSELRSETDTIMHQQRRASLFDDGGEIIMLDQHQQDETPLHDHVNGTDQHCKKDSKDCSDENNYQLDEVKESTSMRLPPSLSPSLQQHSLADPSIVGTVQLKNTTETTMPVTIPHFAGQYPSSHFNRRFHMSAILYQTGFFDPRTIFHKIGTNRDIRQISSHEEQHNLGDQQQHPKKDPALPETRQRQSASQRQDSSHRNDNDKSWLYPLQTIWHTLPLDPIFTILFRALRNCNCRRRMEYKSAHSTCHKVAILLRATLLACLNLLALYVAIVSCGATVQIRSTKQRLPMVHDILYSTMNEGPVCAFDAKDGRIQIFPDRRAAIDAQHTIAHCGACAHCSNWNDLELQYSTRNNLAELSQDCAIQTLGRGPTALQHCLMGPTIGFTHDCARCWAEDIFCTKRHCIFIYLQSQMTNQVGNFAVGPDDITSATCEEAHCEAGEGQFVECSGATRRRMDITSDIERPADQRCNIVGVDDWGEFFYPNGQELWRDMIG